MRFKCDTCSLTRDIHKATTVYIDGEWITKESKCESCEKYMKQIITEEYEGVPNIKLNDTGAKK